MDKRYQIFISSTFTDLVKERQSALKAVLYWICEFGDVHCVSLGTFYIPYVKKNYWLIKTSIYASA
jgi:hypothetical protein